METLPLLVVAAGILAFGLVSGRMQRSVVTPAMAFVLFGMLVGGPALGLVELETDAAWIHTLAELTLIVVLFTDASQIDLRLLWRERGLPMRLLLIGLPLTIAANALAGVGLFPAWGLWEVLTLAAILAPTDAALGQAVVSSPDVPVRIRQTLNVESGLNDGIALPVVLICLSCAGAAEGAHGAGYWLRFVGLQITVGPLVGLAVGLVGGRLVTAAIRKGWMNHVFQNLSALGLALLAYAGAESLGGNGFIAAFCAGLALGNSCHEVCGRLYDFAEAEGQLLTLLIFLVFGAAVVPIVQEHLTVETVLYAALALTLLRMLPVAVSLIGAGLRRETVLFLGWFGPRGIASILFALLVVEDRLELGEEILAVVGATVLLSVFAHGLSAWPFSRAYGRRMGVADAEVLEHRPMDGMRER